MAASLRVRIGRRVAWLREYEDITQAQLAKAVGADPMAISRLERGLTMPSVERFDKIAAALNKDLAEIFDFTDPDTEHQIFRRIVNTVCFLDREELETALRLLRSLYPASWERKESRKW